MKKEELLKVFPSISEDDLKKLPNELVICWYPSSGSGCNHETYYSGYNVVKHWQEQPSRLKPNLFIFSDWEAFEIHDQAEILFTKSFFEDPVIEFLNNPIIIDYDLIPNDHYIHSEQFIQHHQTLFDVCLDENHWISKFENPRSPAENEIYKLEIKLLIEAGIFLKHKIVKELKKKEFILVEEGLFGPVKTLSIIKYLETFFVLVQTTNKFLYSRFVDEAVKIQLLTINRPNDPFIVNDGIDFSRLGVQEFIGGEQGYSVSITCCEEYLKYPDFLFRARGNGETYHEDLANLYSLLHS